MDALSAANNETGRYDFWFRSLLGTLTGRGKMGSLVGASEDIRKYGGAEAALNDYAVSPSYHFNDESQQPKAKQLDPDQRNTDSG